METDHVTVERFKSTHTRLGHLIISGRDIAVSTATIVIGRPGFPNAEHKLRLADAVLYETPEDGTLDIRVLSIEGGYVNLLISQLGRTPGLKAGFVEQDQANTAFTQDEIERIEQSVDQIRRAIETREDIKPEQLSLVSAKLEEMKAAANRLGRKDWLNLAIGTLTSTVVAAALTTDIARALFLAADKALAWLLAGGLRVLTP